MNSTYKIKRYKQQRTTFNSPVLYSTVVEYITRNSKDNGISRDKTDAYDFESLQDAVEYSLKLNEGHNRESEWQVVEIINGEEILVDEDIINSYKNKQTIESYKKKIEEINRKIAKLEAGSPYKRITIENVKIGATLFVVRAAENGKHLSTEKVVIKSDIEELGFSIKAVEIDSVKISGDMYYSDGNLYLSDVGIIPNNYNKSKTFKTLEEAEVYVEELKSSKQGD